ncbi:hypothetical protein BGX34_002033 [Mortierella sp. NVP85]|nr:hypothetical protein BGX34_002033 [Mortierella sp. NVP85]
MMANKDYSAHLDTDATITKTLLSLKTTKTKLPTSCTATAELEIEMNTEAGEPRDFNAPEPIWYVAPPAPSHINPSARRSAVATPCGTNASMLVSPTEGFLSDITLDLDDVMFGSPKEPTPATTVSAITEAPTTPMDMTSSITMDVWSNNAITEIQFALDSPIHELEMQQFCNDLSSAVENPFPGNNQPYPHKQQPQQQQQESSSFFTGFFAIPPSLAGRPRLTEEQEDYVRREHQRGPVPLMWPKEDLEI